MSNSKCRLLKWGWGCVVLIGAMVAAAAARAAEPSWTLTTADFNSTPVVLKGLDAQQVKVDAGGKEQTIPIDNLLSLSRTSAAGGAVQAGTLLLNLQSGDVIAGHPVSMGNEQLKWKSASVGDATVPVRYLKSITRAGKSVSPGDEKRLQDVVTLANGDVLKGIVTDISADKITLQPETGDPTPVPLETVATVMFATPAAAGPTTAPAQRALKVKLSDGSALTAAALTGDDSSGWSITLPGAPAKPLEGSVVVAIEQVNGPVSWLSSRTPSEIVQIPYLGAPWPTRFDRTVKGAPIKFNDKTFAHGIGIHAYSRLTYPLGGSAYKSFRTQYAIDGDLPYADVTVRILLDGKVVHEQKNFRAAVLSPVVHLDLGSAKSLTLEVDFGDNYDTQDRFNWIEPALIR